LKIAKNRKIRENAGYGPFSQIRSHIWYIHVYWVYPYVSHIPNYHSHAQFAYKHTLRC